MTCWPKREGRITCDGWNRNEDGMFPCPHYNKPTCQMPVSDEVLASRRRQFLASVGFQRRYQDPQEDRLFGGVPAARDAIAGLRDYWANIKANLEASTGFMLFGGVGTGKTFALALTALAARDTGTSVRYVYAPDLFCLLHDRSEELYDLERCDLLLLDDLGAEYISEWNMAGFISLTEHRYAAQTTTCVTSNMSPADLRGVPGMDRTVDRWRQSCSGYMFGLDFPSLRGEQPWPQSARVC